MRRGWRDEIRGIHAISGQTYGSPRVTPSLRRRGRTVNHKRVERLMRVHGIIGRRPKRRRSLTKANEHAAAVPERVGAAVRP